MAQTVKEMKEKIVRNDLTWPRAVMIQYLTSFFKHSPDFNREDYQWKEDRTKSNIVIISSGSDLSDINESADRVIVHRQSFSGQTIITDNRVERDEEMFIHRIVKPRLGYLNIFCESTHQIQTEFIATQVEMIILMHKELLLEWNLGIGPISLTEVRKPVSGTEFYSLALSVPTIISSEAEFSVTDPRMLNSIEIDFGVGSAIEFSAKT